MNTQRQNAGGLVGGVILIGLGTLFLLGQFVGFRGFQYLWPLVIIGMGGAFFVGMLLDGKSFAGLAIPGSVLSSIGLMLMLQNIFGHWEAWSYAWTIIIMAVGVGIMIMGAWVGDANQRRAGLRLAGIGFVLFAVFASFFEFLIFGGGSPWRQAVLPVMLILIGLFLIVRRSNLLPDPFANRSSMVDAGTPADARPTSPSQS